MVWNCCRLQLPNGLASDTQILLMPNLLAAQALKLGPIVLETFYKHYAERISADHDSSSARKELLWDEAFHIVKVCRVVFSISDSQLIVW